MNKRELYLDDLKIGDTFISEKYYLNVEKVKKFAQEFDPQDFHCDEKVAEDTFFKGIIASGWHTASITMKLLTESLPIAYGVIGANVDITWPRPTRPNDVLYLKSTIKEIIPSEKKPNQAFLIIECDTINQHDKICQKLTAKVLSFYKDKALA